MTARNYALLAAVIFIIIAILQVLRALLGWPVTVETGAGPFSVGLWQSWVAFVDTAEPGDAYYGYSGPGDREEFWILDVEGTRLMIAAGRSPGSRPADLAELRTVLDSIRIRP